MPFNKIIIIFFFRNKGNTIKKTKTIMDFLKVLKHYQMVMTMSSMVMTMDMTNGIYMTVCGLWALLPMAEIANAIVAKGN